MCTSRTLQRFCTFWEDKDQSCDGFRIRLPISRKRLLDNVKKRQSDATSSTKTVYMRGYLRIPWIKEKFTGAVNLKKSI